MTSAAATAAPRTTPTTTTPTRTTTTTTTRLLTFPRTLTLLLLLATALPPSTPLALPSSNSNSHPSSSSSSLLDKRTEQLQRDCNNDMEVSAICYNCAALSPKDFHTIHSRCCLKPGPVRHLCVGWYTEDPKEGRRLKYF